MTTDVGIVVGIIPDDSGARVIERALGDVNKANKDVEASTRGAESAVKSKAGADKSAAAEVQNVTTATTAGAKAQRDAESAIRSATASAREMQRQQSSLADEIRKTNSILETGKTLLSTYFGVQTIKALRDTAMGAEALRYRMSAAVGSFGDAGDALKFVRDESQRLGLSFKDTAGSFAGFSASALRAGLSMQDVKDIFTGTSEAIRALKLNEQQANSVFLALEQMAGKGTVQMQELKLQLGAALPGAIEIFATAMGKTPQQFYKMVEAGEVTVDSLKTMGQAFHDEFGVAAVEASHSAAAETARFNNTIFQLSDAVGNSTGLMTAYKDSLAGLSKGFGDVGVLADTLRVAVTGLRIVFDTLATSIGVAFSLVINEIKISINGALEMFNTLKEGSNRYLGTDFQQSTLLSTTSGMAIVNGGSDALNGAVARSLAAAEASKNASDVANKSDPTKQAAAAAQAAQAQADARAEATAKADKKAEAERRRQAAEEKRANAPRLKAEREAAREQAKQQNELQSAINGSRTEFEKLNDEVSHLEKLKGVAKTAEQVEFLNRGIKNTRDQIDNLALKAELDSPMAKGFAAVADEVQDGFKDAFKGAFDGGGSLFTKMADGIRATFKSLLLDLAYQAAVRPIVVSVLGSVGGSLGLSGSAISSVLGKTGGSSSGSLLGNGSSLLSLGRSFLSGGSLTSGLGARSLGLSTSLGFGAQGAGNIANFITRAGTFGSLAGGFGGALGANLLGLGNKNGYVNGATGTIGGIIGGGLGGPIGAALGSFAGTALGGLFGGGKPSDKAVYGGFDLSSGKQFGQGNVKGGSDANNAVLQSLYQRSSALVDILESGGATVKGKLFATVGSRDGLRLGTGSTERNYGTDVAAFTKAAMQEILNGASGLGATFKKILSATGTGDLSKLSSRFQFGQSYDATLADYRSTPAKTLADALKALDDNMNGLLKTATKLGLPTEEYTKALQKQKDAQVGALKAQQAGFSSLEEMTRTFDSFFNSQALGANSSLNPLEKLGVAQSDFGGLLKKAQGGDLSVTQDLLSSANTLLGLGRDTYASGADFTGLESFVKSSVSGVAKQSGYTGQNFAANLVTGNQAILAKITELVELAKKQAADSFRAANKAAVA